MKYILEILATLAFILMWIPPARRLGLIDVPNHRKPHSGEIPLVGGLGILSAWVMSLLTLQLITPEVGYLLGSVTLMLTVSVLDDIYQLSARFRLMVQIAVAMIMVFKGHLIINSLGNIFGLGVVHLGVAAIPFTLFSIVGVINAVNMLDGLDGLAGGMSLIAVMFFGYSAQRAGLGQDAEILFLLAAALVGFQAVNLRTPWRAKAKVFMGDAGSMSIGLILAWYAVRLSSPAHRAIEPVGALWVLALPVIDTVAVMSRRILKGRNPFSADQEHLHHIILRAGISVQNTVFLMLGLCIIVGIVGMQGTRLGLPSVVLAAIYVILLMLHMWATQRAWILMKFLRWLIRIPQHDKLHDKVAQES